MSAPPGLPTGWRTWPVARRVGTLLLAKAVRKITVLVEVHLRGSDAAGNSGTSRGRELGSLVAGPYTIAL
jgi:hypothetical protein